MACSTCRNSNASLTPEQRQRALSKIDHAQLLNQVSYAVKTVGFVTQTAAFVLGVASRHSSSLELPCSPWAG